MKKRILSLLLTVAMLLTVTPLTVVAEDCIHEYDSVCDADCNVCGAVRVPEHNPSSASCDRYCIQCFEPLGSIDDHVLGEDGHTCTVCGHILSCADGYHWYHYDCDKACFNCGEELRPEAEHRRSDRPACSEIASCVLCGMDMPPTERHTDSGYGNCLVCNENTYRCEYGYHTTDGQCDAECNLCGAAVEVYHVPSGYPCNNYCLLCGEQFGNTGEHSYYLEYAKAPTCTEVGVYDYYCPGCGDGYTEYPPATDHAYVHVGELEPTCTQDGYDTYECMVCGDTYEELRPATGWHAYPYQCSDSCMYCGQPNPYPGDHVSNAEYPCQDGECIQCGAFVPAGDHLPDGHPCNQWCGWCYADLPALADHDYECYYEQAPTCVTEGAYYYQCMTCGDAYEEYPAATGEHTYDDDTDLDCNVCGEPREVETPDDCAHDYPTECATVCALCGEVREPLTTHVPQFPCLDSNCWDCGELVPASKDHVDENGDNRCDRCYWWVGCDSGNHKRVSYYACMDTTCSGCGIDLPAIEPHVSNNFDCCDGWCVNGCQTPMPAITTHDYEYECSISCTICGFYTRPEAECVSDGGRLAGANATNHVIDYFCQYCGDYLSRLVEEHYDDDGDGACDVCHYEPCEEHVYDSNFDYFCNACGEYREVDVPMDILGVSISEDVNGLAMIFSAKVEGIAFDGNRIIYDNATIGGHKLIGLGAVVSNNYEEVGYAPSLEDVDGKRVKDIFAVRAYDYDEATGTVYFAFRIINIPDKHKDTMIVFTPYFIFENNNGEQEVFYSTAWGDSYNSAANNAQ